MRPLANGHGDKLLSTSRLHINVRSYARELLVNQ